ncbi:MAG: LLM class flavin-dependent oxidoreductase [Ilumatobacteraceae bacterium]
MAAILDVQLNPATSTWPDLLERAEAAEAAGYGAVWTFDHLAGSSLRGDTMLEAFTLLGALATSTSRVELGTMVANVYNRSPALLAVAAASVTAISGRQVHVGIGAGSGPDSRWSGEMRAIGQPVGPTMAARHQRLVDTLDVLHRMYDPDRPAELATFPRPEPAPAVIVGANGPALAALAGHRADGVNVGWDHPRRDELLAAAIAARGSRHGFVLTTWLVWSPELLDPAHPTRTAMDGLDRVILVVPSTVSAATLAAHQVP